MRICDIFLCTTECICCFSSCLLQGVANTTKQCEQNARLKARDKNEARKQVTYNDGDLDIIKAGLARGLTPGKIVEVRKVRWWPLRTAQRWAQKMKKGEDVATKPKAGGGRKLLEPDLAHRILATCGIAD